jgi:hypothetical protein
MKEEASSPASFSFFSPAVPPSRQGCQKGRRDASAPRRFGCVLSRRGWSTIRRPGASPRRYLEGDLMKKLDKQVKKLVLVKETVRDLETSALAKILGGMEESNAYTCYTSTC